MLISNELSSLIVFLLINTLTSGNIRSDVKLEGALQQFEKTKFFDCGHTVQLEVFFCECDCKESTANEKSIDHPKNNDNLCTGSHLCFHVRSKELKIKENPCRAYGICKLRYSPIRISEHVQLNNPKTFNILKINVDEEKILLPSKYTSLVDKNNEFKVHCTKETDVSQPAGWYFWFKDDTETIFKTKYTQSFNSNKEVNVEKYCWYQFGNEAAVMNKTNGLDLLTSEVCNGNVYGWNFTSLKGLHRKESVLNDGDGLPGNVVKARSFKSSDKLVEFYYGCKMENIEHNSNFDSWFEGVYRKDDEVYLKINLNVTADRNDVSFAVWDQSGHEITQEVTAGVGRFVVLPLHKTFFSSVGNNALLCVYANQSSNWCELLDVQNASESELHEYRDFFSTSLPSTPTIVPLKGIKVENTSDSGLINSTGGMHNDLNKISTVELIFIVVGVVVALVLIIVFGIKWVKHRQKNSIIKIEGSSESQPLNEIEKNPGSQTPQTPIDGELEQQQVDRQNNETKTKQNIDGQETRKNLKLKVKQNAEVNTGRNPSLALRIRGCCINIVSANGNLSSNTVEQS